MTDGRDPPDGAGEPAEGRKAFLLRLPPALLADLRRWADEDLRSLNGHLEFLLRQALERRRRGEGAVPAGGGVAGGGGAPGSVGDAPATPAGPPAPAGGDRPGGDGEPIDPS